MQFSITWKKLLNNKQFNLFECCGVDDGEIIEVY